MNTFRLAMAGVSASRRNSRRTDAIGWLASPLGGPYSGCSRRAAISSASASAARSTCFSASAPFLLSSIGTNQCTSGCCNDCTRRQVGIRRMARGHCRGRLKLEAWGPERQRFAPPRGPARRMACGSSPAATGPAEPFSPSCQKGVKAGASSWGVEGGHRNREVVIIGVRCQHGLAGY